MKLAWTLSAVFVFAFASQSVNGAPITMIKGSNEAHRWPVATAKCPDGMKLTGGGGQCVSLGPPAEMGWVYLAKSYPDSDTEWTVKCDTEKEQNVRAEAYAFCSKE